MSAHPLSGYTPTSPISNKQRSAYAAAFPHFVKYVIDELIEQHVPKRKQTAARQDAELRANELVEEGGWNWAIGRPDSVSPWYVSQRDHANTRKDPDLRKRRRKLPEGRKLQSEYEALMDDLCPLLPRRPPEKPATREALKKIQQQYSELNWTKSQNTLGKAPAATAKEILAKRYDVSPRRVKRALAQARSRN
jgi:hypothetical protein